MPSRDLTALSREELEAEVRRLRARSSDTNRDKARQQAVFDSALDFAIVVMDREGIITDWNSGAQHITGWSVEDMRGQDASRIFTPEDRSADRAHFEMALSLREGRASDERWHIRKNNNRFWASGEMMVLRDDEDAHIGFVKIMRDRTAEHLAGEALKKAEERFRTILETVESAFAIVEVKFDENDEPINYRFLEANPAFERQAGVDLRGKWVTEFAPNLERFWFETYGRVAKQRETATFENYAEAFGRWFDVRAVPIGEPADRQIAIIFSDTTERRNAEERLRASEKVARDNIERVQNALAAGAIIGTWHWDLPTDRFTVDDAFAKAFGLDPALGREGIPLAQIVATVHPDDQAGLAEAINEAIARGGRYAHQYRTLRADGRYHWLEANGHVTHGPDGTPLTFPGVLLDVASHRAAALVVGLADRLRSLSTSKEMAWEAARTIGEALDLSRAGYGRMGSTSETVIVTDDWTAPGQRSAVGEHHLADFGPYGEAMNRGQTVVVGDVAREPHTAAQSQAFKALDIRAFANISVLEHGRVTAMLFLHHARSHDWSEDELALARRVVDRTELEIARRATEAQLLDSEARYRTLFETIDVGFCIIEMKFDADGRAIDYRIAEANPAFELQTGADLRGRWVSDFAPNLERHWFDTYGRIALTGEPAHFENWADVFQRWFDVRALRVGDPAAHRVAIFFSDITQRKRMEDALRDLNSSLESRVEERTTELMKTEEALRQSQKMEAVGQLTGGLAHDFNNLLAGISGALEMMSKRIDQGRLGELDRYMVAAQGAAKRAAALTHRLLAFSRRQTLDPRPTDVNTLVIEMVDLIQRTVGPTIAIETVLAADLGPSLIDPSQLENVLLNLCINSRDAMPAGGNIIIETANRRLDRSAARAYDMSEGDFLTLSVSDTGTGMPPDILARVFEPFFTTKPIGQGTGLGLSMIYGFAQQSGGQVRIHSNVGQGTTVRLFLPRFEGAALEAEISSIVVPTALAKDGETVLVVDDEATVRMLLADVLGDLGYSVIEASDGASGLKLLQSNARIDLLITDVGLPGGMNGRQMADAARTSRPDLKILFITGYAESAVIGSGQLEPGMQVLTKPFTVDALAARIGELTKS